MPEQFTTQNPTNASFAKKLESVAFVREVGGFVRTEDREVPHGTTPDDPITGVIDVQVKNNTNTQKSRLITSTIVSSPGVVDAKSTSPVGELSRFTCKAYEYTEHGDGSLEPLEGADIMGSEVKQINATNRVRTTTYHDGFNDRVTWQSDEEGNSLKITESVVLKDTAIPTNTPGVLYEQKQISCTHAILTKREFPDWEGYTKTFYDVQQISHPTLVVEANLGYHVFTNPQTELDNIVVDLNARHGFTCATPVKTVLTLNSTNDPNGFEGGTPATPINAWRTADLYYEGYSFRLQLANVLHDVAYFRNVDVQGTGVVETYYPTVSVPTSAEYIDLVNDGNWILVDDSTSQWKYGLFLRTQKYIRPL